MYIIYRYRYILTPKTNLENKIIYKQVLSKSQCISEEVTNIQRIISSNEHWLEDHFGYIKIYNYDTLIAVFGNLRLFKKTMKKNGILIGK